MLNLVRKLDHKLFFPYLPKEEWNKYYVWQEQTYFPPYPNTLDNSPALVRNAFEKFTRDWLLEKFYFCYTDECVIEPHLGWAITRKEELIPQSLWNNYIHDIKPLYLRYKFSSKKEILLDEAISLRYAWNNYWHFHNDIMGQLMLADAAGLPTSTPILIDARLQSMRYFKDFLALTPALRNRNWVLQEPDTNVRCRKTHFFNTYLGHRENFDAVLRCLNFEQLPAAASTGHDKVFIARKQTRGRNISNADEVYAVVKEYGFTIVECDDLTVEQQMMVFSNAAYIVGIHGAGLTNIIYRRGRPLKLLEFFSSEYINPSYYWVCTQYGYEYFSMVDPDGAAHGADNIRVDIGEFREKIERMLVV